MSPVAVFGGAFSHEKLSSSTAESRMPSLVSMIMKRTVMVSPGSTPNFVVSQPLPPP